MTDSWAAFGRDLYLDLPGTQGRRAALVHALRDAARTGRLAPGTRLPSSRTLAADLGLARNTVAEAYAELVAEGWLTARQGSGTRVAERVPRRPAAPEPARTRARPPAAPPPPAYDLTAGTPDVSAFPRTAWLAAARQALTVAPGEAFGYGSPAGRPELRAVLADYLARARGVYAHPDRIVLCAGFVQGLALLARLLRRSGAREAAVESYGLPFHRDALDRAGLRPVPLPVDAHGARTDLLAGRPGAGAVLLTPAHQFPTGVPLHPDRRAAAVDWARRTGGLVLEDDYDGEFRYDGRQVGALQSLDPEHVVYMGTASKSLAPGLRLSWLVLPDRLVAPLLALKDTGEWQSGSLDQLTLAELLSSGAYDRHVRTMRLRYRRRRDQLTAALAARAPHVRVTGLAAGLHAVLQLPAGTERPTLRAARRNGLALEGLATFTAPRPSGADEPLPPDEPADALVVGYGHPPEHAFSGALDALLRALPPPPERSAGNRHPDRPPQGAAT
ncbi:PLP-dependent aminotransferase family protein [Streptomyces sclerotialus]|uniref:MocR-like pyridoxine biosynthesis transcription factor PdxR n=1 Tax=Streptomyces sclerotialus TaxID=1957 RepID=UPI00068E560A